MEKYSSPKEDTDLTDESKKPKKKRVRHQKNSLVEEIEKIWL